MKASDWIAIYAAVVATGASAWQAWTHFGEHKVRPRLSLDMYIWASNMDDLVAMGRQLNKNGELPEGIKCGLS